jgi:hypothetical protein
MKSCITFGRTLPVKSDADRLLIYLTFYTQKCLKFFAKNNKAPCQSEIDKWNLNPFPRQVGSWTKKWWRKCRQSLITEQNPHKIVSCDTDRMGGNASSIAVGRKMINVKDVWSHVQ